jgi:thioredoxin-like negative regulator of GroEL
VTDDEVIQALVAVAARGGGGDLVDAAASRATTRRQRQLVALVRLHLAGDDDRFDALVRDHLAEHPDDVAAAWLAAVHCSHNDRRPRC